MATLPRAVLQEIDPNSSSCRADFVHSQKQLGADGIDKSVLSSKFLPHKPSNHVERDEYLKACKERDVLVDEVRKLTRELAAVREPDQVSSWQKITASTREMRRMEDEIRELKSQLEDEKVTLGSDLVVAQMFIHTATYTGNAAEATERCLRSRAGQNDDTVCSRYCSN